MVDFLLVQWLPTFFHNMVKKKTKLFNSGVSLVFNHLNNSFSILIELISYLNFFTNMEG